MNSGHLTPKLVLLTSWQYCPQKFLSFQDSQVTRLNILIYLKEDWVNQKLLCPIMEMLKKESPEVNFGNMKPYGGALV